MAAKLVSAGQKSQLGKMLGQAAGRLRLPLADVQAFLDDGDRTDPFKVKLEDLLRATIPTAATSTPTQDRSTPVVNRFAGETTRLAYYYPRGWRASGLEEQRDRLMAAFPGIVLPDPVWEGVVPAGFDGPAYNIFPERLGLKHDIPMGNGENYGKVIETVVMPALKVVYAANGRGCFNHREGQLGPNYIKLRGRGRKILEDRQAATNLDAFIAPISLGQLWAPLTYSPRNAYETAILSGKMLPEGSVQVGCHLVAMPDRLAAYEHLFVDCPGDQYNWDADGCWAYCPYFRFNDDKLKFGAGDAGSTDEDYGSSLASLGV